MVNHTTNDVVDDGEERDAHDHADDAPKTAEQKNREEHPEAGEARGVADDLRAQDVAVKLLQDDEVHLEIDAVHGALEQEQQATEHAGKDGTEERHDVEHEDKDADEGGVLDAHDHAANEAQHRDDEGVDNLAHEETVEHLVGKLDLTLDNLSPLARRKAVEDELCLRGKAATACKHIDADEDAEEQVGHHEEGVDHMVAHTADDGLKRGEDVARIEGIDLVDDEGRKRVPVLLKGAPLMKGVVHESHKGIDLGGQGVENHKRRSRDLRDNDDAQGHDGSQRNEDRQRNGDHAHDGASGRQALATAAERERTLKLVAHRCEEIGDNRTVHERREDAANRTEKRDDLGHVEDDEGHDEAHGGDANACHACLEVFDVRRVLHVVHPPWSVRVPGKPGCIV